jgi:hypothetical protein
MELITFKLRAASFKPASTPRIIASSNLEKDGGPSRPACTDDGLLLGRTPLIERRDGRFVVRERGDIKRLLQCAYESDGLLERLMSGLATVAHALNGNDPCLARIAAVHLKIPDLPDAAARELMEAEDQRIHGAGAKLERRAQGLGKASPDDRSTRVGQPERLAGVGESSDPRMARTLKSRST